MRVISANGLNSVGAMPRRRTAYLLAAVLFIVTFLLYYSLRQENFYKSDGRVMLLKLTWDSQVPHLHFLLPFVVDAFHGITTLFDCTLFETAILVSVISTALSVPLIFFGFLKLTHDLQVSLLSVLLYAVSLPVVFFASAVEYHALFTFFLGIAFLCFSQAFVRPSASAFIVLGLTVWLAQLAHSSGLLLAPLFFFWYFFASTSIPLTKRVKHMAAFALGVIAPVGAQSYIFLQHGINSNAVDSVAYVLLHERTWTLLAVDDVFLSEWLVPFLPASVMVLLPLLVRQAMLCRLLWAFLASFAIYFFFSFLLLIGNPEKGAYMVPLMLLCGLIVAKALRGAHSWKIGIATLMIMATVSVSRVCAHASLHDKILNAIATKFRQQAKDAQAIIVVGAEAETEACLIGLPEAKPFPLYYHCHENDVYPRLLPELFGLLESAAENAKPVFLSQVAKLFLEQPASSSPKFEKKAKRLHSRLFEHYELVASPSDSANLLHALVKKKNK